MSLLQLRLGVFVLEIEELKNERGFDGRFGRDRIPRFGALGFLQHGGFIF